MPPEAVDHLQVLYISPRPVVLVSVDDGVNANMFPMDLVGPIHGGGFTLALRNTSPSVQTLRTARRAALAHVSYENRALPMSSAAIMPSTYRLEHAAVRDTRKRTLRPARAVTRPARTRGRDRRLGGSGFAYRISLQRALR